MHTNNNFIKKNFNSSLVLQFIILLCVIFPACDYRTYNTIYSAIDKEKFYDERVPCEVLMVMKIEKDSMEQLELIGTCKSNFRAGGLTGHVNNAMKEIRKCACLNGGDLLLIVNTQQSSRLAGAGVVNEGPLGDTKIIYSDKIEAQVYRRK